MKEDRKEKAARTRAYMSGLQSEIDRIIPDREEQERMKEGLYAGKPLFGENGIFTGLLQQMVDASLKGELDAMLSSESQGRSNRRNGYKSKQIRSSGGPISIQTPRDRNGEYEPILVKNWERELHTGMDEIIISLYAKGMSVSDVHDTIRKIYGVEISESVISSVTNRVLPEITEWQNRPLNSCYVVLYMDGIYYKVREEGVFRTRVVHTCYGIDTDGNRDILGLYVGSSEGSGNWGLVMEDLRRRGVEDVLFCCVDGLHGFREAIEKVYPEAIVQRCIVHMVRSSTRFVSNKDITALCRDLKKVYQSSTRENALLALDAFDMKWGKKYPKIKQQWLENWDELMAYMDYSESVRKMIYTTNPVEAVHRIMRKITKTKAAWTNENALVKQLYLALMHNTKSWKKRVVGWSSIQNELVKIFKDRYAKYIQ